MFINEKNSKRSIRSPAQTQALKVNPTLNTPALPNQRQARPKGLTRNFQGTRQDQARRYRERSQRKEHYRAKLFAHGKALRKKLLLKTEKGRDRMNVLFRLFIVFFFIIIALAFGSALYAMHSLLVTLIQ